MRYAAAGAIFIFYAKHFFFYYALLRSKGSIFFEQHFF
jgi:hypothetical protein